jgi:CheY-like chemotaxis protein
MAVILVVEDDPANALLITAMLTRAGHHVLTAVDGTGAMDSARLWRPDLVLLDVSLPGAMTGFDVCRALRDQPDTATTPIIMQSGWAFASDVEAGREAKCDDYLAKPYSRDQLLNAVQALLEPAAVRRTPG